MQKAITTQQEKKQLVLTNPVKRTINTLYSLKDVKLDDLNELGIKEVNSKNVNYVSSMLGIRRAGITIKTRMWNEEEYSKWKAEVEPNLAKSSQAFAGAFVLKGWTAYLSPEEKKIVMRAINKEADNYSFYAFKKTIEEYNPKTFIASDFKKLVKQNHQDLVDHIKDYEKIEANNTDLLTESQLIEELNRGL